MGHRIQTALGAFAALVVLTCAGCQLKRINARTFTISSTLSIGIGDLTPGCRLSDSPDDSHALPIRSSIHFTADVRDDDQPTAAPMPERSTCAREHHTARTIKVD